MKKYSALLMAGVTGCANVGYYDSESSYVEIRQRLQNQIDYALFSDTDNDTISDYWDQCIATPAHVKVSVHGCPLDTNGNGEPDYQETAFGGLSDLSDFDADEKEQSLTLPDLDQSCFLVNELNFVARCYGFNYDSAKITGEMRREVATLIATINGDPNVLAIEIVGHTDDRGSTDYNLSLSERRAEMLSEEIKKSLRPGVEMLVSGMGEYDPLGSNTSDEGRKLNRRVEIHALYLRQD